MFKNFLILFAFIGVILIGSVQSCPDKSVYQKCLRDVNMFSRTQGRKFPTSVEEINTFCGKLKDAEPCITDYINSCLTDGQKRAMELVVHGLEKFAKSVCLSEDAKHEMVKHHTCANAAINNDRDCLLPFKLGLMGAIKLENGDKQLGALCCKTYEFKNCIREDIEKADPTVCTPDDMNYFKTAAVTFKNDLFDMVCANYKEGSDACNNLGLPVMTDDGTPFLEVMRDLVMSVMESRGM